MMKYDIQQDWRYMKATNLIPPEIVEFVETTFQIMEIRQRVGNIKGIKFEVRSREQNHTIPHVHAMYGNYSISIAIPTGEVLAGTLPTSQQRNAIDWVKTHADDLQGKWNSIAISATSLTTKSRFE